jgi:hypothetical protein
MDSSAGVLPSHPFNRKIVFDSLLYKETISELISDAETSFLCSGYLFSSAIISAALTNWMRGWSRLTGRGNSPKSTPRLRSAALPSCYPPTADIEVFLLTAARPCGGVTHLTQVSARVRGVCHSANSACDPRPVSETIPHMDQYERTNGRSKRHRRHAARAIEERLRDRSQPCP